MPHERDSITPRAGDALVVVDVQNDFLPGGSLAVPHGDEILPALNHVIASFSRRGLPIFATRDWHPEGHCSFHDQGGPWPPHCVAGTHGAAFARGLSLPHATTIVSKATHKGQDAYSGFGGTELYGTLTDCGARRLFIGGLATDYCVLNTVKDALAHGYEVLLLADAVRAVDMTAGDGERAIATMRELGAVPVESRCVTD